MKEHVNLRINDHLIVFESQCSIGSVVILSTTDRNRQKANYGFRGEDGRYEHTKPHSEAAARAARLSFGAVTVSRAFPHGRGSPLIVLGGMVSLRVARRGQGVAVFAVFKTVLFASQS